MKRRFKSKVSEAIHELASGLHKAGAIDGDTMRDYDQSCTIGPPKNADEIRALRVREAVSQADFAYHLNVTSSLVSQWERGEKTPSGPSLKLLDLVARKGLEVLR